MAVPFLVQKTANEIHSRCSLRHKKPPQHQRVGEEQNGARWSSAALLPNSREAAVHGTQTPVPRRVQVARPVVVHQHPCVLLL